MYVSNVLNVTKSNNTRLIRVAIVGALFALAIIMLIISVSSSDTNTIAITNKNVEKVEPTPGGLIRPTSEINVDLADGYIGRIMIDGVSIPDDEIILVKSLGQLTYKPSAGKTFEKFKEGAHVIQVIFWKADESEDVNPQTYNWDFRVTV